MKHPIPLIARGVLTTTLLSLLAVLPGAPRAQSPFSGSYPLLDENIIHYKSTPPNDPVARLQHRLDAGGVKLDFEASHGYLLSVLHQLNVPVSSQMLVFSKTGFQQRQVSPSTPRALYFNDSVYVGWVQGGDFVEVAAVDPAQGTMFYTLSQHPQGSPQFVRREECLQCHASLKTVGVPGLLMRSVFTAASGTPQLHLETFATDQSSPLSKRWGGWYVTGTHGGMRHMGNTWIQDRDHPDHLDKESGANLTSLAARFDVKPYTSPHSDLVALMVLAHQAHLHNMISRVNWETRITLGREASVIKTPGVPMGVLSDAAHQHIAEAVEALLRTMLFTDEARLEAPVRGTSDFAREFAAAGPRDSAGRSLRDLDLNHRMFRYPCSFLIYSEAFDALPKPALDLFYRRLWEVLTSQDKGPAFADLSPADRATILNILRETKHNLPDYWRAASPQRAP